MSMRRCAMTRSLWLAVGAALLFVGGCAGMLNKTGPAALSGSQEVPPVTTSATGSTDISVGESKCPSSLSQSNCPTVYGTVATSGLTGTTAQIQWGTAGQNGPAIITLTRIDDNTWAVPSGSTLTADQYAAYMAGQLYVNVRSSTNPGGELRAQLKP